MLKKRYKPLPSNRTFLLHLLRNIAFALFSGLAFIMIVGLIFAPIAHRFFHKFHLDTEN